jgi:hypothetical protein
LIDAGRRCPLCPDSDQILKARRAKNAHNWLSSMSPLGSKTVFAALKCDFRITPESGLNAEWHVSNVPILLQKSFWDDDRNFLGPLMRFV